MKLFVSAKTRSVFEATQCDYRDHIPAWRQLWLQAKTQHKEQSQRVSQTSLTPQRFPSCKLYFHDPQENQRGCDSSVLSLGSHICLALQQKNREQTSPWYRRKVLHPAIWTFKSQKFWRVLISTTLQVILLLHHTPILKVMFLMLDI